MCEFKRFINLKEIYAKHKKLYIKNTSVVIYGTRGYLIHKGQRQLSNNHRLKIIILKAYGRETPRNQRGVRAKFPTLKNNIINTVRRLNKRTTRKTSENLVANVLINKYVHDVKTHEKRIKTYEQNK